MSKRILFLQVKDQDSEAYGKFYDLYVERIYRFVFFKVNSVSDAQDLTSEVFLKVWQYLKEGKEIKNLNAFIYLIARNSVIDFYRQRNRQAETLAETGQLPEVPDETQDLLKRQIVGSDLENVLQGLNGLKDEYKEIIILRFLDELSIAEIAEILDKSKGSVRVLLHRALTALKNNVKEHH
ncbi:MAG: RNA polymerase sigma factor [Patescibacteria group bacterium]